MSWRRLSAIVVKELRQLRRDRITLAMIVGIPVMQLVLFGYAINLNLRGLSAGIADEANTSGSRGLVMDMVATGVVRPVASARAPQELVDMLRRGDISIGIAIPADFERRLLDGREAVQILVDGSDTVVQSAAAQLAQVPADTSSAAAAQATLAQRLGPDRAAPNPIRVLALYNPERRSPVNIVPGLIGVILTMTMVLFTAMALVRERERGNLEFLIATPVSAGELTIGKVLPFIGIGLVQVTVVLVLGVLIFHVPIRGSLIDVYTSSLVFIVASLALGVFISTLAQTQFQSMQIAFFTFLPQILLSGFMFPYAGMPWPAQWLAEILPMTHFVRLIRGIMVRGAGLRDLWPELAALGVFIVIMMTIAIARTSKRLD